MLHISLNLILDFKNKRYQNGFLRGLNMFPLEFIPFSNCLKHASAMKFLHKIDDAMFLVQLLNLTISRTTVSCLLSNLMILALFLNSYNNFRNLGQWAVDKDITRCHFLTTFLLSIYGKRVIHLHFLNIFIPPMALWFLSSAYRSIFNGYIKLYLFS